MIAKKPLVKSLVLGAGGQDGSYLCELLLERGHWVTGLIRPTGFGPHRNLYQVLNRDRFSLLYGDLTEPSWPTQIAAAGYDEIYLLAGQTQVAQSVFDPLHTLAINATFPIALYHQLLFFSPKTKVYFAATSEMFSELKEGKADENFPLGGRSPYAIAKTSAFLAGRYYRQRGLFVTNGIGFNHESRRRGTEYVTRKVALGVREYMRGGAPPVQLGNKGIWRDWHYAKDTMRGAILALNHDTPDDFVFASGVPISLERLVGDICQVFGASPGSAVQYGAKSEQRVWDVSYLCGDPSKAERELGWIREFNWDDLIEEICHVDPHQ